MNFYLEAIQDEHIILSKTIDSYISQIQQVVPIIQEKSKSSNVDKIILAGMGSSLYAAKSVMAKMNNAGIFTIAVNAFETLHFQPGLITDRSIVILITQSGNTKEIVELCDLIKGKAALTISMLNLDNCLMRGKCDCELFIEMGQETPISNKTYYGQVAMLNLLAASLTGEDVNYMADEIKKAIDWAEKFVDQQEENTTKLIGFMGQPNYVDILGDDAALGAVLQTGLVWRECMKMNLSAYSISDYSHGWYGIAKENNLIVIFTNKLNYLEKKVVDYCLSHGARVMLFSADELFEKNDNLLQVQVPDAENSLLPLYFIVPSYFVAGFLMESTED